MESLIADRACDPLLCLFPPELSIFPPLCSALTFGPYWSLFVFRHNALGEFFIRLVVRVLRPFPAFSLLDVSSSEWLGEDDSSLTFLFRRGSVSTCGFGLVG